MRSSNRKLFAFLFDEIRDLPSEGKVSFRHLGYFLAMLAVIAVIIS